MLIKFVQYIEYFYNYDLFLGNEAFNSSYIEAPLIYKMPTLCQMMYLFGSKYRDKDMVSIFKQIKMAWT